ncbi:hypothetical protein TcasGA2_TC001140 [Tribolium castaneum]|uniref:Uncharacterized protein n=1 Tax=Tribolium castaneum TaxID=7070 RepID=D6WAC4_TRICA|nr:hypothetical protein TcasGA2_TC001140 [Tribolium castaneum]
MSRPMLKRLKRHASLIPLYLLTTAGAFGAVAFAVRTALQNPDVQWNRRRNEIPNEEYRAKQYKLYSLKDNAQVECPAPRY